MPDASITSTESTFGTISGTFTADQSTITGTIAGVITGTLTGTVGIPGPQGPAGPGSTWGGIAGTLSNQLDLQAALDLKAPLASPLFTGDPRGPTAPLGDSDTSLATTAFVQQELASGTAVAKNLEVYVRNQTGSTLAAGAIVYINGATGNRPTVTLAQANNDANSAQTFGFVKTAIANNGFGYVIVRGELENVDTSALTEGVQLYLSPTTPGAWTTTKPSAPQHLVYVGIVVRAHPTQGVILVAVQNGYELNELHDVAISSPTNGQVLKYDSSTGLWYNGTDSSGVAWGGITGTLSSQTDLQTALDGKYSTSNPAGYITSSALTGYATESFVTSQGYITSSALSGYATESWVSANFYSASNPDNFINAATADTLYYPISNPSLFITAYQGDLSYLKQSYNLSDLTDVSAARTNLGLGTMATATAADYSTTTVANGLYYPLSSNPSSYLVAADIAGKANLSGATFTGLVNTVASTTTTAGFRLPHGTAPSAPVNGDVWSTTGNIQWRRNGSTQTIPNQGTSNTFSAGAKQTVSHSATTAGLNIGPVAGDPSSLANGDVWLNSTTNDLKARINGVTETIAEQSWVTAQGYLTSAPVTSVAGKTGAVTLDNTDVSGLGTIATVNDAPSDGSTYGRNNGAWVVAGGGGGASTDYQAFTTAGTFTWTKPAGAKWVEIVMWGGGGGGGSGARQATSVLRLGGGGGGGGGMLLARMNASSLGATQSVVVGAGGTSGVPASSDTSNGGAGGAGGNSTFAIFIARGGNAGAGGTTTSTAAATGVPSWIQGCTSQVTSSGAGGSSSAVAVTLAVNAASNSTGGGSGGNGLAGSTSSISGLPGGGKTGATTNSGTTAVSGGAGGTTGGTPPTSGATGANMTGGTGGGGGAYRTAIAGMAGANGAFPGGGGGGGSASDNGFASGAGGAGGGGAVYIITYC